MRTKPANFKDEIFTAFELKYLYCTTECHLNLCIDRWSSPCSFGENDHLLLSRAELKEISPYCVCASALARTNDARNYALLGCVMQFNKIVLTICRAFVSVLDCLWLFQGFQVSYYFPCYRSDNNLLIVKNR